MEFHFEPKISQARKAPKAYKHKYNFKRLWLIGLGPNETGWGYLNNDGFFHFDGEMIRLGTQALKKKGFKGLQTFLLFFHKYMHPLPGLRV